MGLKLLNGTRKPAYDAYKLPIWVSGSGAQATVYGQVRPAVNGAAETVQIQRAASAGAAFQTVATAPVTSANGTFTASVPNSGGIWRLRWGALTSRQATGRGQVRHALFVALALVAALAVAAPARADLEIGMEDEGLILSNQHLAPDAVNAWRAMGVDVVRIHARWWEIAPDRNGRRAPSGFNAANHNDPRYSWANLDNAVRMVRDAGMRVMLTITGPGPTWTSSQPSKRNPRWMPSTKAYGVLARGRDALQGPGRSLPDLERTQPAGLAAAAVGLRQSPAQLQAGLTARLSRARARGGAADPRGRLGRRDRRG